ncbi:hypothetical protein [Catenulispora pinisilvae]|uniref:hypothetical protein n=1 Tax=Catenulispora pinisilvae TaxID=2705253 RepID=UPI00189243F6|nr:hypothetical protein [Catenulispora pinisilvae]
MSRHLIPNAPHEHPDVATIVGWDPDRRTYFCDFELHGQPVKTVAGVDPEEVPSADWLASLLAAAGIHIPPMLVARLRLESLALSTVDMPHLDWRSGEPLPVREG